MRARFRLLERWQGSRYRKTYGLEARSTALDHALAARRANPTQWDTPGGQAYLESLRKICRDEEGR